MRTANLTDIAAVAVGAALGTGLRLAIDAIMPHTQGGVPVSTLVVNVLGSFILGALVARLWPVAPSWLRAGLGAGVLGSFTTFSAVAVASISLVSTGEWMPAALYLAATLVLALTAAWAGLRLGRPRARTRPEVDR